MDPIEYTEKIISELTAKLGSGCSDYLAKWTEEIMSKQFPESYSKKHHPFVLSSMPQIIKIDRANASYKKEKNSDVYQNRVDFYYGFYLFDNDEYIVDVIDDVEVSCNANKKTDVYDDHSKCGCTEYDTILRTTIHTDDSANIFGIQLGNNKDIPVNYAITNKGRLVVLFENLYRSQNNTYRFIHREKEIELSITNKDTKIPVIIHTIKYNKEDKYVFSNKNDVNFINTIMTKISPPIKYIFPDMAIEMIKYGIMISQNTATPRLIIDKFIEDYTERNFYNREKDRENNELKENINNTKKELSEISKITAILDAEKKEEEKIIAGLLSEKHECNKKIQDLEDYIEILETRIKLLQDKNISKNQEENSSVFDIINNLLL